MLKATCKHVLNLHKMYCHFSYNYNVLVWFYLRILIIWNMAITLRWLVSVKQTILKRNSNYSYVKIQYISGTFSLNLVQKDSDISYE